MERRWNERAGETGSTARKPAGSETVGDRTRIALENAQHVEMFQEQFNTLNCHVKSLVLKLHATEEKLTVALHQDEMMKHLVHTLEKRKAVIHLEEKMDSLEMDRSQHLNTITMLENKIKEMNESFDKELVSREEHIEDLQQEVEELEKDREQLISINGDVAGEIQECQSRIECLSLAVDKVMESLTGQTLEKENMTAQDAVTSTPRPQVLSQPEKFQSCLSVLSEVRERVTERTANAQQVNRLTGCSQITCTSAVTTTEYSRQNCVCTADDNVVTSAMNTVEDIKAQLRATVVEEMKNRNQEHIAMSKAQEAESELKEKCEELGKIRLELKVAKNKHSSVKRELHELKQQNRHLVKDLSDAGDTMKRTDHEKTNLQHDVEKGLRTIRKQCNMIKELKNTIKNLSKMSHERSATTKFEPKSSRGIQEKAYAQVTMKMPPHKVANKYQSSTESAQDTAGNINLAYIYIYIYIYLILKYFNSCYAITTFYFPLPADHSPSGSNSADDGAYRYEQIKSELELRMKIMESLHHTEVENLNRVHKENVTSLKKAYERESAKERKMYEELVGKQQEMHEEQINELNQLRDSELSFLWDNRERECISEETQTPEDWTGTLAAGEEVSPAQDNGSTDPVTAKGSILLIEENTSDVRVKVSEQQHAEEVDSLKIDHARKLAEITEELRNSLAEEEASLENQLQALRKGNEQKLLWLKTKYRSEMKHENEKFNHCRRGVLEYANKSLSVSKTEVVEIKPSG
ncbi:hypothetical protein PR048_028691 [Dryococelus australis]|uniref:Uncharacterized protein n=1 Tax=Dryococelus australis TaxID=614101 RepID=A0ABQ9GDT3_9NEOP|nr:hypothetical protein PR048_028691 [Dryococelus australis]